ncbi:ornithine cyclodeaminase family protein [Synergistaceae bacterium OttesenSCG-928-D05]|nr:ornithine cyclodeaminase family protein [Synergistaceae bacterium OttesenSCG-928-D05]
MPYVVRFISEADVKSMGITMPEMIEQVELGWKMKGEGKVELPAKPGVHPRKDCYIHAMPCWVGGEVDTAGLKWVAGYPSNLSRNLPYNNGVFILNDTDTGVVKAIMDANWMTTWRTGAAAGIGAKYLADPNATVAAVAGLGTIGKITLRAFETVLPKLKTVKVFDPLPQQAEKYVAQMKELFPQLEFVICGDVKALCADADVVTTCAPILEIPNRTITPAMLKANVCCISSDYDATFDADVVNKGNIFVCDDKGQYLWTQGHGVYFQSGYPVESEIYADMGEIVAGKKQALRQGRRCCVFMGIASHDVMTAKLIYEKAKEKGIGQDLDL